jgi:hypothetical protein
MSPLENSPRCSDIAYCRRRAAGGKESAKAETEINEFLGGHGQSLDWVFLGDPTGMITALAMAAGSPRLRVA